EVTGDRADRLAVIQDQANGLAAKLLIELPAWAPTFPAFGHSGHRIHLSEDVHRFGSSPPPISLLESRTRFSFTMFQRFPFVKAHEKSFRVDHHFTAILPRRTRWCCAKIRTLAGDTFLAPRNKRKELGDEESESI